MLRISVGALYLAFKIILILPFSLEAEGNFSSATKRLFEAVWANDMAGVRASIIGGADISASNESGLLPVDMAVDRGHFKIAHYLLAVARMREKQNVSTKRNQGLPTVRPVIIETPSDTKVSVLKPGIAVSEKITPNRERIVAETSVQTHVSRVQIDEPPVQNEPIWSPVNKGGNVQAPKIRIIKRTVLPEIDKDVVEVVS
ncbi:MAG: hypothetical protein CMF69_05970, partial [Magnetovibrio sp.]|nr:hypothetical protein [Magnetovibrio sp.]